MNLRRLAARNIWQNRGRYLAYLGSSAFSVMIYFLYTSLALHPQLQGGYRGAGYIVEVIDAAAVVIAIFTLLFLLYSGSAFVRSRMKEFGLLTLLGLTRRQLIRMILWENLIIAVTSITIGLGTGLLFLKLFFMAVSVLLGLPNELPIYIAWPVWRQTLVVFGSIFLFVSLLSLRGVLRRNIIELIRAGRKPKESPRFSWWKALLGVVLIGGGYVWASFPNAMLVVLGVVPVTAMVSVGTYLLLRESAIALLNRLRRAERFYHRPGPFLTISQLGFKIQENYRVLSATTILIAVILSAMGTVFTFYIVVESDVRTSTPQAIQLTIPDGVPVDEPVALVQQALDEHGVTGLEQLQIRLPRAMLGQEHVTVVPQSLYARLYRPHGTTYSLQSDDHAVRVVRYTVIGPQPPENAEQQIDLTVTDTTLPLLVGFDYTGRLLNTFEDAVVLTDQRFAELVDSHPRADYRTVAIWTGPAWRADGMRDALEDVRARFPDGQAIEMTTTLETYQATLADFGLGLFIGIFVSLVFFAATCSLLYFRLFTEIDDDRRYYTRLRQLGLSNGELKGLSRVQAMVVFFIPFVVGLVHSTFAMKALGTLVMRTVLYYGWMIAAGYLVLYVLFFAVTYALYWRTMGLGRSETLVEAV